MRRSGRHLPPRPRTSRASRRRAAPPAARERRGRRARPAATATTSRPARRRPPRARSGPRPACPCAGTSTSADRPPSRSRTALPAPTQRSSAPPSRRGRRVRNTGGGAPWRTRIRGWSARSARWPPCLTTRRSRRRCSPWWSAKDLRPPPRAERRRSSLQLHRRPRDGQQAPRRPRRGDARSRTSSSIARRCAATTSATRTGSTARGCGSRSASSASSASTRSARSRTSGWPSSPALSRGVTLAMDELTRGPSGWGSGWTGATTTHLCSGTMDIEYIWGFLREMPRAAGSTRAIARRSGAPLRHVDLAHELSGSDVYRDKTDPSASSARRGSGTASSSSGRRPRGRSRRTSPRPSSRTRSTSARRRLWSRANASPTTVRLEPCAARSSSA